MKKSAWKICLLWILLCEATGALAGFLIRDGVEKYAQTAIQPPFAPPQWLFPVAWGILYALMGIGAGRIFLKEPSTARSNGLNFMALQLVMNFFWPLLFFNTQAFGFSVFWLATLLVLVIGMTLSFQNLDVVAAGLQIPYVLWLLFALYLNIAVWWLNR